jgi:hypothetical protein
MISMVLMTFSLLKVSTSGLFEVVDGLLETFRKFSLVKLVTPAKKIVRFNLKTNTVKLGYNDLGYNELSLIANKKLSLVGLGNFTILFSWL